ncbi:hypothetical protein HYQ46_006293 [Verticillium longisporum]|nr:hypothetical protein HYQ46_006293 [Verticillium longisporum]
MVAEGNTEHDADDGNEVLCETAVLAVSGRGVLKEHSGTSGVGDEGVDPLKRASRASLCNEEKDIKGDSSPVIFRRSLAIYQVKNAALCLSSRMTCGRRGAAVLEVCSRWPRGS